MALVDKLKAANQQYRDTFVCKLMQITFDPKLSKADVAAIIAAINSTPLSLDHIPNNKLAAALREEGFDISSSAVDRHRRGDCACKRVNQGDK